jgi:hypothetical protein
LCSKNSAWSKWVNKEIESFKAIDPGNQKLILSLILDGEPNASFNPDFPDSEECFPPALRSPLEPLAGDLRKEGDGKERGFLKILSGISEIGFDELSKRHERLKKRKRLILGSLAIVTIAALSGLTAFAIDQKIEADDARVRADNSLKTAESALGKEQKALKKAQVSEKEAERERDNALNSAITADLARIDANDKRELAVLAQKQTKEALDEKLAALEKESAAKMKVSSLLEETKYELYLSKCREAADAIRNLDFERARTILLRQNSEQRDSLWALLLSCAGTGPARIDDIPRESLNHTDFPLPSSSSHYKDHSSYPCIAHQSSSAHRHSGEATHTHRIPDKDVQSDQSLVLFPTLNPKSPPRTSHSSSSKTKWPSAQNHSTSPPSKRESSSTSCLEPARISFPGTSLFPSSLSNGALFTLRSPCMILEQFETINAAMKIRRAINENGSGNGILPLIIPVWSQPTSLRKPPPGQHLHQHNLRFRAHFKNGAKLTNENNHRFPPRTPHWKLRPR